MKGNVYLFYLTSHGRSTIDNNILFHSNERIFDTDLVYDGEIFISCRKNLPISWKKINIVVNVLSTVI